MSRTIPRIVLLVVFIISWPNDVTSFGLNSARKTIREVPVPYESYRKKTLMTTSRFSTNTNEVGKEEEFVVTDSIGNKLEMLQHKNELLENKLLQLEEDNQNLQETCSCYQIVIETFEGEGRKSETNEGDTCPIEPDISFIDAMRDRAYWLVGLLAFQSCSGFILSRNEALLETHPVIIYFLTMLVGAGGNAGNQASVRVIRGLALGSVNESTQGQFLWRELKMAFVLSAILSVAGFIRAIVFSTPLPETVAITCALALIVFISICLGAVLPLFLKKIGIDPAHSSTSIQVIMDILGVVLTVFVSTTLLVNPFFQTYLDKITSDVAGSMISL